MGALKGFHGLGFFLYKVFVGFCQALQQGFRGLRV